MSRKHMVKAVEPGSIADELGVEPGDRLISVNGHEIEDVLDYRYYINDEYILLLIEKPDGDEWELEIEKEYEEDPGIIFEKGLMDDYRSCRNKCVFCFIDQLPKGMRPTLYFKDDDSRLSFLQGNYVTLTNMSDKDIDRIIRYHLEPVNISFHTTNPELRCRMLRNRFAGDALKKAERLYKGGIRMNGQIVLCKGINDGDELEESISCLSGYIPYLQSLSVVPVGLTRYRDGLYPLKPFVKEDAEKVIDTIEAWQRKLFKSRGTHFVHAGDEWYIMAGRRVPEEGRYDGYLQLENGVGMLRLFLDEFGEAYKKQDGDDRHREVSVATGLLAYPYIKETADRVRLKFPNTGIHVYPIRNDFFGDLITVTGLITGRDLIGQLKGKRLGERLLISSSMLRDGEDVFLDDITLLQVNEALKVQTCTVSPGGHEYMKALIGEEDE